MMKHTFQVCIVFMCMLLSCATNSSSSEPTNAPTGQPSSSPTLNRVTSKVVYLTLDRPQDHQTIDYINEEAVLLYVSDSDDGAQKVNLPWSFPFFGETFDGFFVDPNGAVRFNMLPECLFSSFTAFCDNFNQGWYQGAIGGIFSDLDPSSREDAVIVQRRGIYRGDEVFQISYRMVPHFGIPEVPHNFSIGLSTSGRVDIWYGSYNISDDYANKVSSGLRPLHKYEEVHGKYILTSEQLRRSQAWPNEAYNTNFSGVYPLNTTLRSGWQFTACPISNILSTTNATVDVSSVEACGDDMSFDEIFIDLATLSLSCIDDITYGALLLNESSMTGDQAIAAVNSGDCVAESSGKGSLKCSLAPSLREAQSTFCADGDAHFLDYYIYLTRKQNDADDHTIIEGIDPVPIRLAVDPAASYDSSACASNFNASSDEACNVYNGVYDGILAGECTNASYEVSTSPEASYGSWSESVYPDIYRALDCEGTCYGGYAHVGTFSGSCCLADDVDCFGECNGGGRFANSSDSQSYLCCKADRIDCKNVCNGEATVDCKGICEGNTTYDVCDTCGGSKTDVKDCAGYVKIHAGVDDSHVLLDFDITEGPDVIPFVSTPVEVVNVNDTITSKFVFTVLESDIQGAGPNITIPEGVLSVRPGETRTFYVNSSIEGFTVITDQTVRIFYGLDEEDTVHEALFYDLSFFSTSTACGTFRTNLKKCISVPTCMFCPLDESMRVLRAVNRSLLNVVTPDDVPSISDEGIGTDDDFTGVCTERWRTDGCFAIQQKPSSERLSESDDNPVIPSTYGTNVILFIFLDVILFIGFSALLLFPRTRRRLITMIRKACGQSR